MVNNERKRPGVVKNYIYNLSYQILAIIVPLITTPYISRVLHASGIGDYSYTYTIAYAFSLVAGLGVNNYGQREIAYRQDNKNERSIVFFELCIIRIITTLIVGVLYLGFSLAYKEYTNYLLLQFFVILSVLFDISWYFQGVERFKIILLRNIVIKSLSTISIFLFVKNAGDVGKYIVITSASVFISNISILFCLRGEITRVDFRCLHPQRQLRGSLEFFIPVMSTQIYSHLDRIMLGAMINSSVENGYYEQARKIAYMITTIVSSLNGVMMSRVSNLYINNKKDEIIKYYKNSFRFIAMIVFPMTIGLIGISNNFTNWFFGNDFAKVSILLKLSAPLIIFMCVGNFVAVQFLSPMKMQNTMTRIYIVAAFVNLVLNFILIPIGASVGALAASIIAEIYSCFAQTYYLKKSEYNFKMTKHFTKYIFASILMGICVFIIDLKLPLNGSRKTFIEILVGMIIYLSELWTMGELKDIKKLRL